MGEFRLAIASELVRGEDKFASEFAVTQIKKNKNEEILFGCRPHCLQNLSIKKLN